MTEHKTDMTITEKLNNNSLPEQKTDILNTKTDHDKTQKNMNITKYKT